MRISDLVDDIHSVKLKLNQQPEQNTTNVYIQNINIVTDDVSNHQPTYKNKSEDDYYEYRDKMFKKFYRGNSF